MNLEVTGKLIEKYDTTNVSDRFRKREFVLELADEINGTIYTNYAKMQLVQNKCDILDRFNVGEVLKVNFNIKGTRYEKEGKTSYFSNLDAWRIENAANAQAPQQNNNQAMPNNNAGNFQNAGYNNGGNGGFQNNNNNAGGYNNGNNYGSQPQPNFNTGNNSGNNSGMIQDAPDDLPF